MAIKARRASACREEEEEEEGCLLNSSTALCSIVEIALNLTPLEAH